MSGAKFYVWDRRWRELDVTTGGVAGWRRPHFVYLRRGKLHVAMRSRVLKALRALAASQPSAAVLGPRLSLCSEPEKYKYTELKQKVVQFECLRTDVSTQCAGAVDASTQAELAPTTLHPADTWGTLRTKITPRKDKPTDTQDRTKVQTNLFRTDDAIVANKANRAPPLSTLLDREIPQCARRLPRPGPLKSKPPPVPVVRETKATPVKQTRKPKPTEVHSEQPVCKELIISESDVAALRAFVAKTRPAALERFDTDDAYKRELFYAINPLVDIERSAVLDRALKERHDVIQTHFAARLGLARTSDATPSPVLGRPTRYVRRREPTTYQEIRSSTESNKSKDTDGKKLRTIHVATKFSSSESDVSNSDSDFNLSVSKFINKRPFKTRSCSSRSDRSRRDRPSYYERSSSEETDKENIRQLRNRNSSPRKPHVIDNSPTRRQGIEHAKSDSTKRLRENSQNDNFKASMLPSPSTRSTQALRSKPQKSGTERDHEERHRRSEPSPVDTRSAQVLRSKPQKVEGARDHEVRPRRTESSPASRNKSPLKPQRLEVVRDDKERPRPVESPRSDTRSAHSSRSKLQKLEVLRGEKERPRLAESPRSDTRSAQTSRSKLQKLEVLRGEMERPRATESPSSDTRSARSSRSKLQKLQVLRVEKERPSAAESAPSDTKRAAVKLSTLISRESSTSSHTISKKLCSTKLKEYSNLEDHAIVAWVSTGARASRVNGNALWRELQEQYTRITGQNRSWHSLRNRYLRYILPALGALALPPSHVTRLRAAAATGEIRRRNKPAPPPRRNSIFNNTAPRAAFRPARAPSPPHSLSGDSPEKDNITQDRARNQKRTEDETRGEKNRKETRGRRSETRDQSTSPSPPIRRSLRYSDITRRFVSPSGSSAPTSPRPAAPTSPTVGSTRTRRLYNPKSAL